MDTTKQTTPQKSLETARCRECGSFKGFIFLIDDGISTDESWECIACGAVDSNEALPEDDPRKDP